MLLRKFSFLHMFRMVYSIPSYLPDVIGKLTEGLTNFAPRAETLH